MAIRGDRLEQECQSNMHGRLATGGWSLDRWEFDPSCQTCCLRNALAEHDHLHLGGEVCKAEGLGGPGVTVKCRCGSYHH